MSLFDLCFGYGFPKKLLGFILFIKLYDGAYFGNLGSLFSPWYEV